MFKVAHDEVIKSRQQWFWRRITLQFSLLVLLAILSFKAGYSAVLDQNWPDVTIIGLLLAAIVWLITIYFAAVNDAAKIGSLVSTLGGAIGEARGETKKEE